MIWIGSLSMFTYRNWILLLYKVIRERFFLCYPCMMCLDRFVTLVWNMFTCRQIDDIIQYGFSGGTGNPSSKTIPTFISTVKLLRCLRCMDFQRTSCSPGTEFGYIFLHFPSMVKSWRSSTNPPLTYPPPRNKGLIAGLIKGNQWLIRP